MKKTFIALLVVLTFLLTSAANAQEKDTTSTGQKLKNGVKSTGKAIGKGAKAVGHKTAEVASKSSSKIVDKTYKGKAGPNGETIYINEDAKYYWVDKTGHRHYVTKAELKDKVD